MTLCRHSILATFLVFIYSCTCKTLFGIDFNLFANNDELVITKSQKHGCVVWKGVEGCNAATGNLNAIDELDEPCQKIISSQHSGYCLCAWGEESRVDCGHEEFTCEQRCRQGFPRGVTGENESWLKNSVWHWNEWREVVFHSNGVFSAPTDDCQSKNCFWMAKQGILFIMWGDAGLHSVKIDSTAKTLEGSRYDGERCAARYVSSDDDGNDEDEDNENNENNDFYDVLGLDFDSATDATIKKAFRELSKKYHPDRAKHSGDLSEAEAEKLFEKVRSAYDVLSDPDKRLLYDTGGMEAVNNHVANQNRGGNSGGLFNMFGFGNNNPHNNEQSQEFDFTVSLADLYNGNKINFELGRRVVCRGCDKLKNRKRNECVECGHCPPVTRTVNRQMGNFIIKDQVQEPSPHKCKQVTENIVAEIERGMKSGDRLVFPRMSDQTPGIIPGDIICTVNEQQHEQFERDGDNLKTIVKVPLINALTGFSHDLTHLDDHVVKLNTDPISNSEDIIYPGKQQWIKGEGMPLHNFPSEFGDLLVSFDVEFPDRLTEDQVAKLREILD